MKAISPEQIILTALSDLAVAAVQAWKDNDADAMAAAIVAASDVIASVALREPQARVSA